MTALAVVLIALAAVLGTLIVGFLWKLAGCFVIGRELLSRFSHQGRPIWPKRRR